MKNSPVAYLTKKPEPGDFVCIIDCGAICQAKVLKYDEAINQLTIGYMEKTDDFRYRKCIAWIEPIDCFYYDAK